MTTAELVARQKAVRERIQRYSFVFVGAFLLVLAAILFFLGAVAGLGKIHPAFYLLGLLVIAPFALLNWCLDKAIRRLQRRYGVLCPHCEGHLTGMSGQITVATGRCGHCGSEVVEVIR